MAQAGGAGHRVGERDRPGRRAAAGPGRVRRGDQLQPVRGRRPADPGRAGAPGRTPPGAARRRERRRCGGRADRRGGRDVRPAGRAGEQRGHDQPDAAGRPGRRRPGRMGPGVRGQRPRAVPGHAGLRAAAAGRGGQRGERGLDRRAPARPPAARLRGQQGRRGQPHPHAVPGAGPRGPGQRRRAGLDRGRVDAADAGRQLRTADGAPRHLDADAAQRHRGQDVAETIFSLVSSNPFVTGETIVIDGGYAATS